MDSLALAMDDQWTIAATRHTNDSLMSARVRSRHASRPRRPSRTAPRRRQVPSRRHLGSIAPRAPVHQRHYTRVGIVPAPIQGNRVRPPSRQAFDSLATFAGHFVVAAVEHAATVIDRKSLAITGSASNLAVCIDVGSMDRAPSALGNPDLAHGLHTTPVLYADTRGENAIGSLHLTPGQGTPTRYVREVVTNVWLRGRERTACGRRGEPAHSHTT